MFKFDIRATEKDPSGYYHPRWDLAERLTINAETREEAITKAKALLGEKGERRGWPWAVSVYGAEEI